MNVRIFYVANIRLPNAKAHGLQLLRMCQALAAAGADLTLVVPKKGRGDPLAGIASDGKISIRRLPALDLLPGTSFGFNLAAASFAASSFFYLLLKRLEGAGTSVIYTIDLDQFSFILLPLVGWPTFMEMHGSKRPRFPFRFFLKRVRGIVAVNAFIKQRVSQNFSVPAERILVCPNGVGEEFLSSELNAVLARRELNLPADGKICLYVGRVYNWKGLDILPAAAEKIRGLAEVYLVGGKPEELEKIAQRGLPENLHVIQPAPSGEVLLWLAAADVLLVTGTRSDDYSYYETSPMKLFEYMAARRPVIAAKTPAIESVVSADEVVFYEPDNPVDLAGKIRQLFGHREFYAAGARRAFEKAKTLTWRRRAETVLQFITACS